MITIRGTFLEIAARGAQLLKAQGACAISNESHNCMYYDETTGNRCIIGLLVTEDDAKDLEFNYHNCTVDTLDIRFPDIKSRKEKELIELVQNIHDQTAACINIRNHSIDELIDHHHQLAIDEYTEAMLESQKELVE